MLAWLLACGGGPPYPPALVATRLVGGPEVRRSAENVSRPVWARETAVFERTAAPTAVIEVPVVGAAARVGLRMSRGGEETLVAAELRDGRWLAEVSALAPGRWDVAIAIDGGSGFVGRPIAYQDRDDGKRPNVLLIVVDTLRADHLGCYGHDRPTTPSLDALAATAVRFERATSQAAWTLPSMASLLTGRYAESHGVVHRDQRLSDGFETLAERLAAGGYTTGAVVSGTFTDATWGFDQGFDAYDDLGMVTDDLAPPVDHPAADAAMLAAERRITSPEVTDRAVAWLDRQAGRRFFLVAHYFDPHSEFVAHPGTSERFPPRPIPWRLKLTEDPQPENVEEQAALYEGEVAFTDAHVGRLLDALRERGLDDETVVVVTSDHGEEFHERQRAGHGHALFGELVRVPLIVRLPGAAPGVVASPVALVDVLPTLLDVAGLPPSAATQGRSLLPLIRDRSGTRGEPVYASWFPSAPPESMRVDRGIARPRGYRVDDDLGTLVRIDPYFDPRPFLFAADDPEERTNLRDTQADRAKALDEAYLALRTRWRTERPEVERVDLAGLEQRLEALGYVSEEGAPAP